LLEQKLNSLEDKYDVLNLSVAGYTIQDEANILRSKGLTWHPDTVIIGYVLNDPEIEPVQELPSYFDEPRWWQYSHVLRLVARGIKKMQINLYGGGDYYQYLHANKNTWQSAVSSFNEIRDMVAKQDTKVIVLIFPILDHPWEVYPYLTLHQQVAALAQENGFMVVDLYNYMAEYSPQDLRVSLQDGHPNALVHRIAAEALFENFPR
jgi:hypothetical protein